MNRRVGSILLLVALAVASCEPPRAPAAGGGPVTDTPPPASEVIALWSRSRQTGVQITTAPGERPARLDLVRDDTVAPDAMPSNVRVIGEVAGSVVIMEDTYPSIPGGLSYCQAGAETFVRVLSLAEGNATETLRLKVNSCRGSVELARPITWEPSSATLRVHWLLGGPDGSGQAEAHTYCVRRDAGVCP
jgi:hypothetical protein